MEIIFNDAVYFSHSKADREALIDAITKVSESLTVSPDDEHATVKDRLSQVIALIENNDFEGLENIEVDPVNFTYSFTIVEKPLVEALKEEGYEFDVVDKRKGIDVYVENEGEKNKVHISIKSPLPDEEGLYKGQGIYSENGKVRKEQLDAWNIIFKENHDEYYTFDNLGNVTFKDQNN